jgi:hypothetical protein
LIPTSSDKDVTGIDFVGMTEGWERAIERAAKAAI